MGNGFDKLVCREDLRRILKQIQGSGKSDNQAKAEIENLLAVIWDRYLAASFELIHLIKNKEQTEQVQFVQLIVVSELLKALYNSELALKDHDKIELITTA